MNPVESILSILAHSLMVDIRRRNKRIRPAVIKQQRAATREEATVFGWNRAHCDDGDPGSLRRLRDGNDDSVARKNSVGSTHAFCTKTRR
jgi:hypothetical protein